MLFFLRFFPLSNSMQNLEQYSGGYSPLIIEQFKQRSFAKQGAFLKPYLTPGLTVLDCGCGPGSMTLDIAELVKPAKVFGIDNSEIQIQQAMALQQQRNIEQVEFTTASIYELPYLDQQFDIVFAHAVLYHLAKPEQALAEIHRVLKPNGLIAVRDACHSGDIMVPWQTDLAAMWMVIEQIFTYQGGNIYFGSEHRYYLLKQGFQQINISCSYDCFATEAEKDSIFRYWCQFLTEDHYALILAQHWATADEVMSFVNVLKQWCDNPASFFARARCEAVARK
jgi:ubiquinone/menaquinone biosynthesis C-methylase UbiE